MKKEASLAIARVCCRVGLGSFPRSEIPQVYISKTRVYSDDYDELLQLKTYMNPLNTHREEKPDSNFMVDCIRNFPDTKPLNQKPVSSAVVKMK